MPGPPTCALNATNTNCRRARDAFRLPSMAAASPSSTWQPSQQPTRVWPGCQVVVNLVLEHLETKVFTLPTPHSIGIHQTQVPATKSQGWLWVQQRKRGKPTNLTKLEVWGRLNWMRDIVGQLAVLSLVLQTPTICAQSVSHSPMGSPRLLGYSSLGQETHQKSQARFNFPKTKDLWKASWPAGWGGNPSKTNQKANWTLSNHFQYQPTSQHTHVNILASIILERINHLIPCRVCDLLQRLISISYATKKEIWNIITLVQKCDFCNLAKNKSQFHQSCWLLSSLQWKPNHCSSPVTNLNVWLFCSSLVATFRISPI